MNEIMLSYSKLENGQKGGLKPNADGEYRVRLGGVNVFNANRILYLNGQNEYDLEKAIRNDGKDGRPLSMLNQMMIKNSFFGEAGHPNWEPGHDEDKFFERNLYVDPKNISHSIRKLYWIPTNEHVDVLGLCGNIVYIDADIFPCGPYGEALKKMLESEKENVSFSIRALVDFKIINGVKVRILQDIIAWDWVCLPGIVRANKMDMIANRLSIERQDILNKEESILNRLSESGITIERESISKVLTNLREREENKLGLENESYNLGIKICEKLTNKSKYENLHNWK